MENKKGISELHTDTRILMNFIELKLIKESQEVLTYEELSSSIGRDVCEGARGLLKTARKHVEQDNQCAIDTIHSVGIKLTQDFVGILDKTTRSIGRKSRREISRITTAMQGVPELDNETVISTNARISMLGAISVFAKPRSAKKIEGKVKENSSHELPTAETLRFFSG